MTAIGKKEVRYRVEGHKGLRVLGLHHVPVNRKDFPEDDNFNMDFLNMDLRNPPKPVDPNEVPNLKALGALRSKQEAYRKYMKLSLTIAEE